MESPHTSIEQTPTPEITEEELESGRCLVANISEIISALRELRSKGLNSARSSVEFTLEKSTKLIVLPELPIERTKMGFKYHKGEFALKTEEITDSFEVASFELNHPSFIYSEPVYILAKGPSQKAEPKEDAHRFHYEYIFRLDPHQFALRQEEVESQED